ncbi:hypothetical protein ACWDZ4_19425 [Streptomyces sp. NPDC003016]
MHRISEVVQRCTTLHRACGEAQFDTAVLVRGLDAESSLRNGGAGRSLRPQGSRRRRLVDALAAQVEHLRAERELREQAARLAERAAVAAGMHEVLARRLSLVALHTGVLTTRRESLPDPVADAPPCCVPPPPTRRPTRATTWSPA